MLVNTVGLVLGADIAALKTYQAPEITTGAEFAAALTEILGTIQPVVDWLLFGEDYAFFSKNGADLVTIKGAEGYAYGLAPILEALGVDAPAKDEATVANVLEAVFARVDAVLADPVNEAFDLLPNLVYFLNANGVSVSVQNLLAGVTGLMGALKEEFGADTGVDSAVGGYENLNSIWRDALADLRKESEGVADMIEDILGWDIFDGLIDSEGLAPNGLLAFFQKIVTIFQSIIEWFRNFFG